MTNWFNLLPEFGLFWRSVRLVNGLTSNELESSYRKLTVNQIFRCSNAIAQLMISYLAKRMKMSYPIFAASICFYHFTISSFKYNSIRYKLTFGVRTLSILKMENSNNVIYIVMTWI